MDPRRRAQLFTTGLAAAAVGAAPAPAPAADRAAWLYQPDRVVQIDLRLPAASLEGLEEDPGEYVRGTFRLTRRDGATHGPLVIGVRLKGHFSFRPMTGKAAFKLKFGEYVDDQTFRGLKTMVLNNMVQDPTMLHETLAYKAFRATGLAAWRTGYAFVRVNGDAFGVYLNLESPDDVSVARWYDETTHLYEGEAVDLVPGGAPWFQVEEGDEDDRRDLDALIASISTWTGMEAVADLRQMTRYWAVEKYIGHWDSYSGPLFRTKPRPNNYYLHSDSDGRFTMLPWGTDQTFIRRLGYGDPGGVLFNRCLDDPACEALYGTAVEDVRKALGALDLRGLATRTARLLAPWQRADPRREHGLRRIRGATARLLRFIKVRPGDTTWLTQPAATPPSTG